MATQFIVKQVQVCKKCKGKQLVQHPAWDAYWEEHKGQPSHSHEYDLKWFEDHGWINAPGYRLDSENDGFPHEEIACRECHGEGYIETEVDLFTALKAYKEMDECAANIGDAPCTCGWH